MNLHLDQDSEGYRKLVYDVIKIFYPRFQWSEDIEHSGKVAICWENDEVTVQLGDHHWEANIQGLDNNEVKRTMKLAIYRMLQQETGQQGSYWGILTGIRPTKIVHRFWDRGLARDEIAKHLQEDFMANQEKIDLLLDTTTIQRKFLLTREKAKELVSIYVAIPFCPTRCSYCSFPSFHLPKAKLLEEYLVNVQREIVAVAESLKAREQKVETIYIGGGTPTTLSAEQLEELLATIVHNLVGDELKEFTVEAGRPDTITREKLEVLKQYGVDRISINPQTMWEPTLKTIGRHHTVEDILEKFYLAREVGFKCINMDLIIGLPGEKEEHFAHTLTMLTPLKPENITIHTLAVKRAARLNNPDQELTDTQEVEAMYGMLKVWLKEQGYSTYYLYRQKQMLANLENIGCSLPGYESLYNIQMMEERQTIWGLGVGSASKMVNADDWTLETKYNPKDLLLYNERIEEIIKAKVDKITCLS